jgi:hypothetical protein
VGGWRDNALHHKLFKHRLWKPTGTASTTYVNVVRWYSAYTCCQMEGPDDGNICRLKSSWEADRSSASQELASILWFPKFNYRIHKRSPFDSLLRQINTSMPSSHFLNIRCNIFLPSTPRSSKWSLDLRSPHRKPIYTCRLTYTCNLPASYHSCWFDHSRIVCSAVHIVKFPVM